MKLRNLVCVGIVSLFIPVSSHLAFAQSELSQTQSNSTPVDSSNQNSPCPPPPTMGGKGPEGNALPPWSKDINLSNQQIEQIKTLHEQSQKDTESLRQQLHQAEDQMRSLLESDAPMDKLQQQHQQIQTLRQQLDDKHFQMMVAENKLLTPAQRSQISKFMQQHRPPQPPM